MHIVHLFCRILFSKAELFKNAEAFVFLFSKNMLVYRVGICKMLVGIATREDPYQTSRGGSMISGKGVHIYKQWGGWGGGWLCQFHLIFQINFIFIGYLKMGAGNGVRMNPLNTLWMDHWTSDLGMSCLSSLLWQATIVQNFRLFNVLSDRNKCVKKEYWSKSSRFHRGMSLIWKSESTPIKACVYL